MPPMRPIRSSESRWSRRSTPAGLATSRIGSPLVRNGTPWYDVGKKPLDQLAAPPLMPYPEDSTTKPGRSADSLPSP